MAGLSESYEILVCGLRPEGGLVHLASLVAFVWLARRISPRPTGIRRRLPRA
ncbi:MAG: hypothetical protein R3F35_15350 [Myxococcota bacterium]